MTELLTIAIKAALHAGSKILEVYEDAPSQFSLKADRSPLTKADHISHMTIFEMLKDTPYPILSEEGAKVSTAERLSWKTHWLVDPLDGTKEFIKRNGEFTVNIALISNGKPLMGVIYIPVLKVLYFADENGAFKATGIDTFQEDTLLLQSQKLPLPNKVSKNDSNEEPDPFVIVTSSSHPSKETEQFVQEMRQVYPNISLITKGSSLKLCLVAEGSAHCYPRFAPTMEWDTAAGQAICEYAGCTVVDYETKLPLKYGKENLVNPWFIAASNN